MATDLGLRADGTPRKPPKSPSRRQPHKNWFSNAADRVERQMELTGYEIWGFVIYRTTYVSDADWEEFLRRLRYHMEKSFDRCNGRDILDRFKWTVFSDPALFDGADTAAVRAHSREWSETALRSERVRETEWPVEGIPPSRYQFCVQVDEDSLRLIVHDTPAPPKPDGTRNGWVKLINKKWIPIEIDPNRRPGWEDQCVYPPIEGITEHDVGWQKVWYAILTGSHYSGGVQEMGGAGVNGWMFDYRRPPEVN